MIVCVSLTQCDDFYKYQMFSNIILYTICLTDIASNFTKSTIDFSIHKYVKQLTLYVYY